jgi:hypothetical protein
MIGFFHVLIRKVTSKLVLLALAVIGDSNSYTKMGIKVPQKGDKWKYYILDWKTASARGWDWEKQQDFLTHMQLLLYKHFWMTKNNLSSRDVQCAFVLLK